MNMEKKINKNAEKFTSLMIEKIESLTTSWEKPWFSRNSKKQIYLPMNITGRFYKGGNILMLLLLIEKFNYKTPIFLTFNQAKEEGLKILKGSESFPVCYIMFTAYHKETNKKITLEEYKELSESEKNQYKLVGTTKYYLVFNLEQTNFSEVNPERWESLLKKHSPEEEKEENNESYQNSMLDSMLKDQTWVCTIITKTQDTAYFARILDKIVLPQKVQFKDGESFYVTMLHEMAHSTGTPERLNREKGKSMMDYNYGKEELIAELAAALAALSLGISATIREENAAYLKSWCKSIKEDPTFLMVVLKDAMKASEFITEKVQIPDLIVI